MNKTQLNLQDIRKKMFQHPVFKNEFIFPTEQLKGKYIEMSSNHASCYHKNNSKTNIFNFDNEINIQGERNPFRRIVKINQIATYNLIKNRHVFTKYLFIFNSSTNTSRYTTKLNYFSIYNRQSSNVVLHNINQITKRGTH